MKILLKKIFVCILLTAAVLVYARGGGEKRAETLTVYGIRGPSGIGMIRMFEEPPEIRGVEVHMEALASADLIVAKFIAGEALMGMMPPNAAAKIASSGKPLQIAAVAGTGMLSLLSADSDVRSMDDLRGKTVAVAGAGATPDYVFRRLLLDRGIDPEKDLVLDFALAIPEIAQSLIAGRISTALLPEPFATMARQGRPELRQIGDIQGEWRERYGGDFPMTVLAVDASFAAANRRTVEILLESLKDSSDWVTAHPAGAGALVEKYGWGLKAPVAAAAIPRSGYVFIPAAEARPSLEALYTVFLEFSPQSIGGHLPGDSFYLGR